MVVLFTRVVVVLGTVYQLLCEIFFGLWGTILWKKMTIWIVFLHTSECMTQNCKKNYLKIILFRACRSCFLFSNSDCTSSNSDFSLNCQLKVDILVIQKLKSTYSQPWEEKLWTVRCKLVTLTKHNSYKILLLRLNIFLDMLYSRWGYKLHWWINYTEFSQLIYI